MIIAVYAHLNAYSPSEAYSYFLKSLINKLAVSHSEHSFYFIQPLTNVEFDNKLPNLQIIDLNKAKGFFSKYLFHRKISQILRGLKTDVLFSIDLVIKTSTPQCLLINKLESKNFRLSDFQKPYAIFCLSEIIKEELIKQQVDEKKIKIVYGGPGKLLGQVSDSDKLMIKEKYTHGKEYFLYRGLIRKELNIISLLKAFSLFKKRQKSTMKLVMLGKIEWEESDFSKIIKTYKYRDDVIFIESVDEEKQLISAAFAFIQPYKSNSLFFMFDALQNNIPTLIDNNSSFKEISLDASLYFDITNAADIADKLMLIYKDEKLYSSLVEKGKKISAKDYWQETTKTIMQNLQQIES